MEHIFVPVLDHKMARSGLDLATEIGMALNAVVDVLLLPPAVEGEDPAFHDKQAKEIDVLLEEIIVESRDRWPAIKRLRESPDTDDGIASLMEHHHYDLLVLGRGRQEVINVLKEKKYFRNIPLMLAPGSGKEFHPHNIVLSLDLEDNMSNAFVRLVELADSFAARLHLVYIGPGEKGDPAAVLERLEGIALERNLTNYSLNTTSEKHHVSGIKSYCRRKHADMLAVITSRPSLIWEILEEDQLGPHGQDIPVYIGLVHA